MNIWIVKASEPMPVVNQGERLLRMGMIAEELSKRGHEVTWFSSTFDHFKKKQLFKKTTKVSVKDNYKIEVIYGVGYKKNISISRIINHKMIAMKFAKMVKKMQKPDVIFAAFPTIDYAEEAVKYGKRYGVPVIVDVRDLWPDIFNHNLSGIKKLIAQPYITFMTYKTKKIMKDAFAISSISGAMLDWGLQKAGRVKNKNDRYFYLGYSKLANSDVENKNIIDKTKFNISFFATINNQYNYDIIVKLAEKLAKVDENIIINIGGDGPQFAELQKKTENCKNIKLLGWISRNTMSYLLENSKIGLAPYKNTFDFQMSVSNKFAEYLAYGLPVIMSVDGYMKSLLQENECGVSSQNVDELVKFIVDVKNNQEKYKNMSENARSLYEEKFVAAKIYKELADYLESVKREEKI